MSAFKISLPKLLVDETDYELWHTIYGAFGGSTIIFLSEFITREAPWSSG